MREYISTDPAVRAGQPHIAGRRISVEIISDHVAAGYSVEQIRHAYPHLSAEQIDAAIGYAQCVTPPAT